VIEILTLPQLTAKKSDDEQIDTKQLRVIVNKEKGGKRKPNGKGPGVGVAVIEKKLILVEPEMLNLLLMM